MAVGIALVSLLAWDDASDNRSLVQGEAFAIFGTVIDGETQIPIPGVQVTVEFHRPSRNAVESQFGTTDDAGQFVFRVTERMAVFIAAGGDAYSMAGTLVLTSREGPTYDEGLRVSISEVRERSAELSGAREGPSTGAFSIVGIQPSRPFRMVCEFPDSTIVESDLLQLDPGEAKTGLELRSTRWLP